MLKIGIVIADDMEYAPISRLGGSPFSYFGREGHAFRFFEGNREIEILSVCCGIGKTNAAAAAMHLIDNGCQMILNAGLSGGIKGISRGKLMLCTRHIEYDFDLTPLGYKPAVKPSQQYIYDADKKLLDFFSHRFSIKHMGMAVTGDRFVSDENTRQYLISEYSAMSCDMETAAIASVCFMANVPFLSLRRISDDAGAEAIDAYRDMNENEKFDLAELLMQGIKAMLREETFFS